MLEVIKSYQDKGEAPWVCENPDWHVALELYPEDNRFYFLFKQGIQRTNVCHVELMYLIQMHLRLAIGSRCDCMQFISLYEFKYFVDEVFSIREELDGDGWGRISKSLEEFVNYRIIYDAFETGAVIYLPRGSILDLEKVTAFGGYIHSCGDLVFSWNSQLIDEKAASIGLQKCLRKLKVDERVMIVPYCHEDFTEQDRKESEFLKDGLDNVKLHISKTFIRDTPIHNFVIDFVEKNKEFSVSAPSDYKKSREKFEKTFPEKEMVTIWIIADNEIGENIDETHGRRFLISYRQRFKNDNPYHHYEENKPAWVSHTTLPHSLAGAMINLARRWLPDGGPVICDPFCGSGTIYLEAQKYSGIRCYTSDKSPLAERILRDNIAIFQLNNVDLEKIINELDLVDEKSFSIQPIVGSGVRSSRQRRSYQSVIEIINDWSMNCRNDFLQLDKNLVEKGFQKIGDDLVDRIVLYVALRTNVRGQVAMMRDGGDWFDIFQRELKELVYQMNNHLKSVSKVPASNEGVSIGKGQYSSVTVTPKPYDKREDLFGSGYFDIMSVEELPSGKFDAIICDPPYGFNTTNERWFAEEFSKTMIPSMIESLKPVGQIIMASPRTSFSGRKIPFPLRSDYITRAILEYCAKTGRQCWKPSVVVPDNIAHMIEPPYYWKAEKTLNRKILHFWIRPA